MQRKVLEVHVELEIQAVTCPGVWLCPSGQVSLHVYMLDSCIQTSMLKPVFPLLYHEKFVFYKVFESARNLSELQKLLNNESFYGELIQWQNCNGNVMASFQSSLGEVLYPTSCDGAVVGVDIDLLMEQTKNFPGILAPKIEVNTRTTVEQIFCKLDCNKCTASVVNPKVLPSDQINSGNKQGNLHQQKVCHSVPYHRSRKNVKTYSSSKPPFTFRKVDENLISRKPELCITGNKCNFCRKDTNLNRDTPNSKSIFTKHQQGLCYNQCNRQLRGCCPNGSQVCQCGRAHINGYCPLCCRYNNYFKDEENNLMVPCPVSDACVSPKLNKQFPSFVMKVQPYNTCCPNREEKTYTCSPTSDNKRYCCRERQKPTLAEQIHNRIKQTFDCTSNYDSCCASPTNCGCPKSLGCNHRIYKSIGNICRELQKC